MPGRKTLSTLAALVAVAALAAMPALADSGAQKVHLWFGAVHASANLTLKDAGSRSFQWDRGKITAISSSLVTIEARNKQSLSFALDAGTVVRNDGAPYSLGDLKVGQRVSVFSNGSGHADLVRHIRGDGVPTGGTPSPLKDGPFAKAVTGSIALTMKDGSSQSVDYNRGRITAMNDSSITIERADKQSITLSYDASTVVRESKNVESVGDLKVGEGAMFFSQGGKAVLIRCVTAAKEKKA